MRYPDYPHDASFFYEINGKRMHYLDSKKTYADVLVMLHGNPSWSFYYRRLFNALRDDYHCIVPDHVGMGLSDKPANNEYIFTLEQRVNDLEALLDQLVSKDKPITLIVHDWGGMIGLAYATRYPERIKALVISNTAGFKIPADKNIPWQLKLSRTPLLGKMLIQGLNLFCKGAVKQCVTRIKMEKSVSYAYLEPHGNWKNRLSVLRFVEDIPLHTNHPSYAVVDNVDKNLHQFNRVPKLICWGLNDFVFDNDFLAEWKRRFPDAEYHEFDAGHYLLEDAHTEVIPLIKSFVGNLTATT